MSELTTNDIILIVVAQVAIWTTVFLNIIFFIHVIWKILTVDLGLNKYIDKYIISPIKKLFKREPPEWDNAQKVGKKKRKHRRKKTFLNRHMRIFIILQFFTVGCALADAYTVFPLNRWYFMCYIQSIHMQIFNLLVFIWSSIVAFFMFYSIFFQTAASKFNIFNWFMEISSFIIVWVLSSLTTLPMILTNSVGDSGGWCWTSNKIVQFTTFYIPLWILIIIDIFVYGAVLLKIFVTLHRTHHIKKSLRNEDQLKIVMKLLLYPCIFLIVWTIPTIRRFLGFFGVSSDILAIIHAFITPLQGGMNVVVYFLNPIGHLRLIRNIFCFPCICISNYTKSSTSKSEDSNESFIARIEQLVKDDVDDDTITYDNTLSLIDNEFESGSYPGTFEDESYLMNAAENDEIVGVDTLVEIKDDEFDIYVED